MGEFQISNLPLIIIAIVLISIGALGYFEVKKLYIKLNSIVNKIDEMSEILSKNKESQVVNLQPPPHIIQQQQRMMMQQRELQEKMKQIPEEISITNDNNNTSENKEFEDDINHDEYSDDYSSNDDNNDDDNDDSEDDDIRSTDELNDELENQSDNGSRKSSILEDITNLSDKNSQHSEMTIELDNEFKHLSIKELKDLCKEKDLAVSGNKTKLIERLLENTK